MGKVQGDDGSVRQPDIVKIPNEINQTEIDAAARQELNRRGSDDVSRGVKKPKSQGLISRVMSFLRGMWSRKPTSPTAVNTQVAGATSHAVGVGRSERGNTEQSKEEGHPEEPPVINKRPGPSLRPQGAERPNYNAMRPALGSRPLPIPGQRVVERKNYNAMTPDAMRRASEEEEALDDLPPPSDLPPSLPDDLPPPSDLPPSLPDDYLPPPLDLPPEWSDDLLPKEVEEVVVQARNNDVQLGYLFREVITTEETYLDGLQQFDEVLDELIAKDPNNDKLLSLSRDHKAHLAIVEEFSSSIARLKNQDGLNITERVVQLYDEELMQRYAESISTLACKYGTNLKVMVGIQKNLHKFYPELAEMQVKKSILSDKGIILPIQRMPRHVMLVMGMKENAPQNQTELKEIVDNLQALTTNINEAKRNSEIDEAKRNSNFFRRWI